MPGNFPGRLEIFHEIFKIPEVHGNFGNFEEPFNYGVDADDWSISQYSYCKLTKNFIELSLLANLCDIECFHRQNWHLVPLYESPRLPTWQGHTLSSDALMCGTMFPGLLKYALLRWCKDDREHNLSEKIHPTRGWLDLNKRRPQRTYSAGH